MANDEEKKMLEHYKDEAKKFGESASSTMEDLIVRNKEVEMIENFVRFYSTEKPIKVLDLGCGNGYALEKLSKLFPDNEYIGVDYSKDLIKVCQGRKLKNCKFMLGDSRKLPFQTATFDIVYTERCLINVLDNEGKKKSLDEIHRVLTFDGKYLMIEAFTDGLVNCNKARKECGLSELKEAPHNVYFTKRDFHKAIKNKFVIMQPYEIGLTQGLDPGNAEEIFAQNFLSSHYFISRVLHALVTKGGQVKNTEFSKFFTFLKPMGNYSQVQAFALRKAQSDIIVAFATRD